MAAKLVKTFSKYAAGSGISEIKCILAGFIMKGFLGAMTLALKSLTLVGTPISLAFPLLNREHQPLVIASGLSVGKEGPSVHVACCIGYVVARLFKGFAQSQGAFWLCITRNEPHFRRLRQNEGNGNCS